MVNDIIIPYIKYLWGVHWIFRTINPFTLLYFIIGPAIIWHIKPYCSPYKRYLLIFVAFVISILIYAHDVEYKRSLRWFEYHLCADPLDIPFREKQKVCNSPSLRWGDEESPSKQNTNTKQKISIRYMECIMILLMIFCSPLWGGVRIAWRVYHRKTIKELGEKYRWKMFDNITIFLSLVWFIVLPIILIIGFTVEDFLE